MIGNSLYFRIGVFFSVALAGAPAAVWCAVLEPHSLEVQVLDRQNGDAITQAAVCLGTSADTDQFGARRTNTDGIALFEDVPASALLLTVSGRGLQGHQQLLDTVSQNRVIVLKVATGGGGPQCEAPAGDSGAIGASGLTIEHVSISEDPARPGLDHVLLSVEVSGKANQMRVSRNADFAGAEWQTFRSPLSVKVGPGYRPEQLYVQVRHHVRVEGAVIEVASPVSPVALRRN